MYFTEETEAAIVAYNSTDSHREKNAIYNEHLRKPFEKLVENIIHTFKFYYFDIPIESVKHEVISFMITRLDKYKQGKGKAFSYFSVVVKNWLICHNKTGELAVTSTTDAENPLPDDITPLLTLDVWEHAYYLDYQNERGRYLDALIEHLLNWEFASANFARAK